MSCENLNLLLLLSIIFIGVDNTIILEPLPKKIDDIQYCIGYWGMPIDFNLLY